MGVDFIAYNVLDTTADVFALVDKYVITTGDIFVDGDPDYTRVTSTYALTAATAIAGYSTEIDDAVDSTGTVLFAADDSVTITAEGVAKYICFLYTTSSRVVAVCRLRDEMLLPLAAGTINVPEVAIYFNVPMAYSGAVWFHTTVYSGFLSNISAATAGFAAHKDGLWAGDVIPDDADILSGDTVMCTAEWSLTSIGSYDSAWKQRRAPSSVSEPAPFWTISLGNANRYVSSVAAESYLYQNLDTVEEQTSYHSLITVANRTAGGIYPVVGSSRGEYISANGTAYQFVTSAYGDEVGIVADGDFDGDVTSIQYIACESFLPSFGFAGGGAWELAGNWEISGGVLTIDGSYSSKAVYPGIMSNEYFYYCEVTVTEVEDTVYIGYESDTGSGWVILPGITAVGTYSSMITPTEVSGTSIDFYIREGAGDVDATISNVDLRQITNLVTAGEEDDGSYGDSWTTGGGASLVSDTIISVYNTTSAKGYAYQTISTTSGKEHCIFVDTTGGSFTAGWRIEVRDGAGVSGSILFTDSGTDLVGGHTYISDAFTTTSSSYTIVLYADTAASGKYTNYTSVRSALIEDIDSLIDGFNGYITGWEASTGAEVAADGERLKVTNGASGYGYGYYDLVGCEVGKVYNVIASVEAGSTSNFLIQHDSDTDLTGTAAGDYEISFKADSTTVRLKLAVNTAVDEDYVYFDDVWVYPSTSIVSNGNFASPLSWSDESTGTGTAAVSSGVASILGADTSNVGIFEQDIEIVTGQVYRASINWASGTADSEITTSNGDLDETLAAGDNEFYFTATDTGTVQLAISVYGAGTCTFDSVAVEPVRYTSGEYIPQENIVDSPTFGVDSEVLAGYQAHYFQRSITSKGLSHAAVEAPVTDLCVAGGERTTPGDNVPSINMSASGQRLRCKSGSTVVPTYMLGCRVVIDV